MSDRATTPVNADVRPPGSAERRGSRASALPVVAAISAGGMIGALARYGLSSLWPHPAGGFPWVTFVVNVSGCLLIGVLMVLVTEVATDQRLLRPFLGVGVLGGYTTFSTYVVDGQQAATAGAPEVGLAYLAVTLLSALSAVWVGATMTGGLVRRVRRAGGTRCGCEGRCGD